MNLPDHVLHAILVQLQEHSATAADFIISILQNSDYSDNIVKLDLDARIDEILDAFRDNQCTRGGTQAWAHREAMNTYAEQLLALVYQSTDGRFCASKATAERLEAFDIDKVADEMKSLAPQLWEVLGVLLDADTAQIVYRDRKRREWRARKGKRKSGLGPRRHNEDIAMEESEGNTSDVDMEDGDIFDENIAQQQKEIGVELDSAKQRRQALMMIKQTVCISIMMNSTNQRCNSLQALIGVFLHACNSPEAVTDLLAHVGISVSVATINAAITSLSNEAFVKLRKLSAQLLT
ncbi:hypothetical protein C8R42DRAFT_578590, partial [Lentinula raphanica]